MLPGPVFAFELVTTARRGRFYLARTLYAMVLFVILLTVHATWLSAYEGELPGRMVKWFALSALVGITIGQELCVLALTPALVAGVIADERRRKTLHYLLASRLTGGEIVLGLENLPKGLTYGSENMLPYLEYTPVVFEAAPDAPVAGGLD